MPPSHQLLRTWTPRFLSGTTPPTFRVCFLNMLASSLVEATPYPGVPRSALTSSHRLPQLVNHLLESRASIIAVCELDEADLHAHVAPKLKELGGYELAMYQRKTGRVVASTAPSTPFTPHTAAPPVDGSAIFFDPAEFSVESSGAIMCERLHESPILDRPQVAAWAVLRLKRSTSAAPDRVLCAATHLLYNPRRGDVKLAQLKVIVDSLANISSSHTNSAGIHERIPLILAGDFNFTPCSPLYAILSKQQSVEMVVKEEIEVKGVGGSQHKRAREGLGAHASLLVDRKKASGQEAAESNHRSMRVAPGHGGSGASTRCLPSAAAWLVGGGGKHHTQHTWNHPAAMHNTTSHSPTASFQNTLVIPDALPTHLTTWQPPLPLRSAYYEDPSTTAAPSPYSTGEPTYTTNTRDYRAVVDYLWYSNGLECTAVLEVGC